MLISEDTKVTKSGFTFQELILSEAGIFIHVVAINYFGVMMCRAE